MKPEIVLCVDSESAKNPELIGLGGENLLSQPWLRLFCSAVEARAYLREADAVKEAWVASSDEMDPINLAAALKKDAGATSVCLVTFGGGGSLKSRASAAGIDATLTGADFASRYSSAKSRQPGAPRLSRAGADRKPEAATVCESVGRSLDLPTVAYPAGSGDETVCLIQGNPGANRPPFASESVASETKGDACGDARKASLRKTAFLITVVSATGGAGKSTVAALSAFFAQGFGYKTLLVDADLQAGDMRRLVGEESPVAIDEVIADRSRLEKAVPRESQPALLAAPKKLEQSESVASGLSRVVDDASSLFDVIVANTSSHWDESLVQLLERSSHVLFLVDQRPTSLGLSKHVLEMCSRCGIATTPFTFVVNRCTKNALITSFEATCSLGGSRAVELKDGGKEVAELLGAGLPLELIGTRNDLCLSMERVLIDILPGNAALGQASPSSSPERTRRFFLGRRKGRAACL